MKARKRNTLEYYKNLYSPFSLVKLKSISAYLKRKRMYEICDTLSKYHKLYILDAFAGLGFLTDIYCRFAKKVVAIEKDKRCYKRLVEVLEKYNNVECYNCDNLVIMDFMIRDGIKFNIIDLDPYSLCDMQIQRSMKLMDEGLLVVTESSVGRIRRAGRIVRHKELVTTANIGKLAKILIDYIKKFTDKPVQMLECLIGSFTLRLYARIGDFKIPDGLFSYEIKNLYAGFVYHNIFDYE